MEQHIYDLTDLGLSTGNLLRIDLYNSIFFKIPTDKVVVRSRKRHRVIFFFSFQVLSFCLNDWFMPVPVLATTRDQQNKHFSIDSMEKTANSFLIDLSIQDCVEKEGWCQPDRFYSSKHD